MEKQFPPFSFSVLRIFDSQFYAEESINPDAIENVKVGYGLAIHIDIEESWVQYNIMGQFSIEDKVFTSGTVVTKFGVDNLKAYMDNDNNILWPANVLEIMFSIAFSHMRALLAKNMAATRFSNFIIPLVDPSITFKQLMETLPEFQQIIVGETKKATPDNSGEDVEPSKAKSLKKQKKGAKRS